MKMSDSCPWGISSFVRIASVTSTVGFQGRDYETSETMLREAGEQMGVKLAIANGRVGSTWRHGPRDAPYTGDSVVIALPDGAVNLDSDMGPCPERRLATKTIRDHFGAWLRGEIGGGRPPRHDVQHINAATRSLLARAGLDPDRVERLATISTWIDGRLADGSKVKLHYSETYGHTGTMEIIPGTSWNGKCITVRGTILPETVVKGMKGEPMRSVVDLEAFDGMTVGSVVMRPNGFSVWPARRKAA